MSTQSRVVVEQKFSACSTDRSDLSYRMQARTELQRAMVRETSRASMLAYISEVKTVPFAFDIASNSWNTTLPSYLCSVVMAAQASTRIFSGSADGER